MLLLTSNCFLEFYNLLSQTLSHSLCQGINTLNSNVKSDTAFKGGYYIITVFECYIWSTFKDGYYVITAFECYISSRFKDGYYIITVFECRPDVTFKGGYYVITVFENFSLSKTVVIITVIKSNCVSTTLYTTTVYNRR